jgi:transcriptional regulator with XRE-family HTH domain
MKMRTRIRELRKLRGLTLKELADKIATTPQTVQRLETANMTVSTAWLERIAGALNVEPAELISTANTRDLPFLGRVGASGSIYRLTGLENQAFTLDVPADNPVAVRLDIDCGRYQAGATLIASKLRETEYLNANGADCLVGLTNGSVLLRRVLVLAGGGVVLAPLDPGSGPDQGLEIAWIARIVMSVRYF